VEVDGQTVELEVPGPELTEFSPQSQRPGIGL
jgi:hypothetical protein